MTAETIIRKLETPPAPPKLRTITPAWNHVLIVRDPEEEVTHGKIILPSAPAERMKSGVIAAVGPGLYGPDGEVVPVPFQPGQRVLFPSDAENPDHLRWPEVDDGEQTYVMLAAGDIWATVQDR